MLGNRQNALIVQALCLTIAVGIGTANAQVNGGPNCEWARQIGHTNIIYGTDKDDAICAVDEDCTWAEAIGMTVIRSTDGDDFICPGHGNDYVNAGDGDDTIYVDPYRTRPDRPKIAGENGHKRLYGGNGDDAINDARNSAYIVGGCGRDVLSGGNGNDVIYGYLEPGDTSTDCATAHQDWDSLNGDAGNDVLIGGVGYNELIGSTGYNYCDGSSGITEFGKGCDLCWGLSMDNAVIGGKCNNLKR